eukprot:4353352-Alexandrium_andersonii.AAC.1
MLSASIASCSGSCCKGAPLLNLLLSSALLSPAFEEGLLTGVGEALSRESIARGSVVVERQRHR